MPYAIPTPHCIRIYFGGNPAPHPPLHYLLDSLHLKHNLIDDIDADIDGRGMLV
jgi:hypothetical protein